MDLNPKTLLKWIVMDQPNQGGTSSFQEHRLCRPGQEWPSTVVLGIATTSLGILAFIFLAEAISLFHVTGELRELAFYVTGSLLLAPICAGLKVFISRQHQSAEIEATHIWMAAIALSALTILPLLARLYNGGELFLFRGARLLIVATCGAMVLAFILHITVPRKIHALVWLRPMRVMLIAFIGALAAFLLFWFWIDPDRPFSNPMTDFFSKLFNHPTLGLVLALLAAALAILSVMALTRLEIRQRERGACHSQIVYRIGLGLAIGLTWLCFFDFSLPADALHNMTNIGPALHLRFGGVLMVDTFSQYGPGPVLVTLLGLTLGPTTIPMGNLVVQIQSLLFYSLWLACLYRMSALKLPSLLIGFLSIGVLMAGWGQGDSNINFAPSILGPRYLPILFMVLAISLLRPPRRLSILTAASTMIAGLWSAEALIGALGIHLAFLGMLGLRDRSIVRLLRDVIWACAPVLGAIAALSSLTLLQAGRLPDYHIYLQFMSVYGMLSPLWSLPANPLFLGWSAILLAIFLVLADAWLRIFDRSARIFELCSAELYYRFLPMALLAFLMSAYFVGRSVEYVLILAFLPFVALVFPGLLRIGTAFSQREYRISLLTLPILVGMWALSFSLLALTDKGSSYSLLIQECRDHGRCTPSRLIAGLQERLRVRPVIDKVEAKWSRFHFDESGAVREAVDAMQRLATNQPTVNVFIGSVTPAPIVGSIHDNIASDMALLYAGKWHRWPRSYGFSDELVPELVDQIVSTPIRLNAAEIVIVRRDETSLGEIESKILRKIRAEATLCLLPEQFKEIAVYRVAGDGGCSSQ